MKKILILEENTDYCMNLREELKNKSGINFYFSSSSKDALKKITTLDFDVIVFDYNFFDIKYIKLLNTLKKKNINNNTKFILTSWEMNERVFSVTYTYQVPHMLKPFSVNNLYKTIAFLATSQNKEYVKDFSVLSEEILAKMGFKTNLIGYTYINLAITYCCTNNDMDSISITKDIYPYIRKCTGSSLSNIERNIRNAIHSSFNDDLNRYTYILDIVPTSKIPTNKQFIFDISHFIKSITDYKVA